MNNLQLTLHHHNELRFVMHLSQHVHAQARRAESVEVA